MWIYFCLFLSLAILSCRVHTILLSLTCTLSLFLLMICLTLLHLLVPWNLSNDAIKAAVAHHSAPEAQVFIGELMLKVITIMTMQR